MHNTSLRSYANEASKFYHYNIFLWQKSYNIFKSMRNSMVFEIWSFGLFESWLAFYASFWFFMFNPNVSVWCVSCKSRCLIHGWYGHKIFYEVYELIYFINFITIPISISPLVVTLMQVAFEPLSLAPIVKGFTTVLQWYLEDFKPC